MKDLCVKLSGFGALLICIPVIYQINRGDLFNPASYFLWSMLSVICVIVLVRAKDGGYTMMAGYFLSDLSIGISAYLKNGKVRVEAFEWFIIALTVICAAIYVYCELQKSFKLSVIVNGVACMIAGAPLMIDSIQNPYKISFYIVGLYMIISFLGYYGERNFNGKFIPGLSIIYWIVIVIGVLIARW